MDLIDLSWYRDRWRAVVNAVVNLRVPWNAENFLACWGPDSFWGNILFHTVSQFVEIMKKTDMIYYVYWNVHHFDSWVKRDQLDVICFIISLFNAQHVSDVNTSILRSLLLMCWVISWVKLMWFDVCWSYVVVWLWWCGIRMQAEALLPQPAYGYHTTTAIPQRNSNTHRTRSI